VIAPSVASVAANGVVTAACRPSKKMRLSGVSPRPLRSRCHPRFALESDGRRAVLHYCDGVGNHEQIGASLVENVMQMARPWRHAARIWKYNSM